MHCQYSPLRLHSNTDGITRHINHYVNHNAVTLFHRQSSGEARAGYYTGVKEAGGGESGLESARSGDCVSTANPSSMQIHLQTLHLNTGPTGAKRNTKTQSASLVSHSRGLNQKRK